MKRILSLILAMTLVFSMIPAVFAAEVDYTADGSNFFMFTNESHGLTEDTNFHLMKHTLATHVNGVGDPWAFVNLRTGNTYGTTETAFKWTMNVGDCPLIYNPGGSTSGMTTAAVAFELVFDTPGTFNPVVTYISATSSPKCDFYLVDATKETKKWYATPKEDGSAYQLNDSYFYSNCVNKLSSNDYLGTIDMYGNGVVETATFPARTVKAQSYYLVVIPNGQNESMALLAEGTSKFATAEIKSFAMAERPELTDADALTYNFTTDALDTANIPNFGGQNTTSYKQTIDGEQVTVYGMRSSARLHYFLFVDWRYRYNYRIARDENGKAITYEVVSDKTYTHTQAEKCDPYPTMLLSNTAPYAIEGINASGGINDAVSTAFAAEGITSTFKYANYKNGSNSRPMMVFRILIPKAGKYNISVTNNVGTKETGAWTQVYFGKAPAAEVTKAMVDKLLGGYVNLGWYGSEVKGTTELGEIIAPAAGEYMLIFNTSAESNVEVFDDAENHLHGNETFVDYSNDYQEFYISSAKLTPVEDTSIAEAQAKYDEIAEANDALVTYEEEAGVKKETTVINSLAAYIDGTEIATDILDISEASVGVPVKVTAPVRDGYKFLYWAKGTSNSKMIMSRDEEYEFIPYSEAMSLIAVYDKDGGEEADRAEFYNANGQLITVLNEDGKAPELPVMAGFEPATHWALYGSDDKFYPGDDIIVSGTKLFVANYDDKKPVKITAIGGTASATETEYGEEVTVTALERASDGKVFNCWMRDGKAVSFECSYTFKAWEDATLTAVYDNYKPSLAKAFRKIVLDSFVVEGETESGNKNAIMAEFIGLSDAVEKGIMFGSKRVAMTTGDTQFSVIDDIGTEAIGYAILADGTLITDK